MLAILILAILYAVSIILIFYRFKLWGIPLLKNTLIWFLGQLAIILNIHKAGDPDHFKKLLVRTIKWSLITEFILGFYSFPLIIELFLIPILFILLLSAEISKSTESVKQFYRKSSNIILSLIFLFSLYKTISHYREAFSKEKIEELFLSPIMTILFIPYLYLLRVYIDYEMLKGRLKWILRDDQLLYSIRKRQLFYVCKLNHKRIELANFGVGCVDLKDQDKFQSFLTDIRMGVETPFVFEEGS
jgi:hypothetical protein